MGLCRLGKEYLKDGFLSVDNVFLKNYLPAADGTDVKVYLYGLYYATAGDEERNGIEAIAMALKLSEERVMTAFRYWHEEGLVTITKTNPVEVVYRSPKAPATKVIRLNASKYADFTEDLVRLFPERVLSENELLSYCEMLERYKIDINAMLLIAKYCIDMKAVASTPYILAVAERWAKEGLTKEPDVLQRIAEIENNGADIRQIFAALGLKSEAGLEDRQAYLKWSKEYRYDLDALLVAARACKRKGGMTRLTALIEELHNAGAHSATEVDAYLKQRESLKKLASELVKKIGAYYADLDAVIEVYLNPWLGKGFEEDALRALAEFCFVRNLRTLEAMDALVGKFYKLGYLTAASVRDYVAASVRTDDSIRAILELAGGLPVVGRADREYYRTFVEEWGFDDEAIGAAAKYCAGKPFPMANINRVLSRMKAEGVLDAEAIAKRLNDSEEALIPDRRAKKPKETPYPQRTYSKEELGSVFTDINATIDTEDL